MGERRGGHGRRPHEATTCDCEHPSPKAQHASAASRTRVDCSSVVARLCEAAGNGVRRPFGQGQRQAADMLGSWPVAPRGGDTRTDWNNIWSVNSNDPYPVVQGPRDSPWFHTLLHAGWLTYGLLAQFSMSWSLTSHFSLVTLSCSSCSTTSMTVWKRAGGSKPVYASCWELNLKPVMYACVFGAFYRYLTSTIPDIYHSLVWLLLGERLSYVGSMSDIPVHVSPPT